MRITDDWEPYCGAEYGKNEDGSNDKVAGEPIICTRDHHLTIGSDAFKHRNDELDFEWW